MKKKLIYVFLVSLLVVGSSAFAMLEEEGASGRTFNVSRSKVLDHLNTDKTLEVGGHHYKVTGTIIGTAGEMFTKDNANEIIHFYNGWTYNKAPTTWQYMFELAPTFDESGQIIAEGGDGVANLQITRVD